MNELLLEIRAVVFRMAVGDRRPPSSSNRAPWDLTVVPAEADRLGVVVQLVEAHAEALPDCDHDANQQGGAIGSEERVEGSTDAVQPQLPRIVGFAAADARNPIFAAP